jgi:hypothetical protein
MRTELHRALAAYIPSRRDAYVDAAFISIPSEPVPGTPVLARTDMEQMIDGFISLLHEALVGESKDVRTFYLETLIPSLVHAGSSVAEIVSGVVEFAVIVSIDLVQSREPHERAEAQAWLARFWNEYIGEMVRVGEEAAK